MTPPEATALARRVVACPRWRWMPGMVTTYGQRIARVDADGYAVAYYRGGHLQPVEADALPDLSDPATLGCLLALVREAWGDPGFHAYLSDTYIKSSGLRAWATNGWISASRSPDGRGGSYGGWGYVSEAQALVASLESTP